MNQNCHSVDASTCSLHLKPVGASFCSELLSKSGLTHVCHYSWNGQLWLHQNDCTFLKIHSLSTGGAHSRVEANITSPTFPPYVGKQLTALFHTQPPLTSRLYSIAPQTVNCVFQLKPSPSAPSIWPLSPTRLGIRLRDLGLPNEYTLGHCGLSAASRHKLASTSRQYSLLIAADTTVLY